MKYLDLLKTIQTNVFTTLDVYKYFNNESTHTINIQLNRFVKKKLIHRIKKGIYCFEIDKVDELALACFLYSPSYISLETALNYYGIMPDITQEVTCITTITTKLIKTQLGRFSYAKIKKDLFWGFRIIQTPSNEYYRIAYKEKALLDYFYIRKVTSTQDLRLDLTDINTRLYKKFLKFYPKWVHKIKLERHDKYRCKL